MKDYEYNGVYRMKTEHRFHHFPVQVRSAGYSRFSGRSRQPAEEKPFLELFWCTKGEFQFTSGILRKNEVCCYLPGDLHSIVPLEQGEYYWITFDGEELEMLIRSIGLQREPRYGGSCPIHLFEQLMKNLRCSGEVNELRCGSLGYEILTRSAAALSCEEKNPASRFCQLAAQHLSNPEFSILTAAKELQIHRSTLMRQMLEHYGISPQKYLTSCRLQQAEALLKNTNLLIKEIAVQSGFSDSNYFCKIFRREYGISPAEFRKVRGTEPAGQE